MNSHYLFLLFVSLFLFCFVVFFLSITFVILQNVPGINSKNDSVVFICINMWQISWKKWQRKFGNVYLYIQTCERGYFCFCWPWPHGVSEISINWVLFCHITYWYFRDHLSSSFENQSKRVVMFEDCFML